MKYVILIHSNPVPWDHPTQLYTAEGRALPPEPLTVTDVPCATEVGETARVALGL